MTLLSWIIGVAVFGLDIIALLKLQHATVYSRSQKALQGLLVLFLPIVGAIIVVMMNNLKPDRDRGDFPPAPPANRDAMNASLSNFNP